MEKINNFSGNGILYHIDNLFIRIYKDDYTKMWVMGEDRVLIDDEEPKGNLESKLFKTKKEAINYVERRYKIWE